MCLSGTDKSQEDRRRKEEPAQVPENHWNFFGNILIYEIPRDGIGYPQELA
jgi:hypothetical protein